jgi:hypothetical protein
MIRTVVMRVVSHHCSVGDVDLAWDTPRLTCVSPTGRVVEVSAVGSGSTSQDMWMVDVTVDIHSSAGAGVADFVETIMISESDWKNGAYEVLMSWGIGQNLTVKFSTGTTSVSYSFANTATYLTPTSGILFDYAGFLVYPPNSFSIPFQGSVDYFSMNCNLLAPGTTKNLSAA